MVMIVDIHTHYFRPELDFGPTLRADMARCGVDWTAWGDVGERHLETTQEADVAVVFGLLAQATGWNTPNEAVAAHVGRTAAANRITDYRGLYAAHPFAALALAFFLLCLAGLPPGVIGLFAKVTVFSVAVGSGLGRLAAVMAVNVVIALYYYLAWTAVLFRAPAAAGATGFPAPARTARHPMTAPLTAVVALTAVLAVALSGAPQLVLRFAATALL